MQTGNIEASTRETALNIMAQHDLFVLEIGEHTKENLVTRFQYYFNRIKAKDLVVFTRQFAVLLEAHVSLPDALMTLYRPTQNQRLRDVILNMSSDVEAGLSLSQSLEKYPQAFSEFYVNMVRSAEITGRMNEVMLYLADHLEKEYDLARRVRNALIYPAVVIAVFVAVAFILTVFVFPKIVPIFEGANVRLPFYSRALISATSFMISWWWAVLVVMVILGVVIVDYVRTPEGKAIAGQLSLKIPLIGSLLKKLYVARVAESIAVLVQGGIPATRAVELTSHSVGNTLYSDLLHEVAERINAGQLMAQAFSVDADYFPPILMQMVEVGEKTGRLEEVLKKVSQYYTTEVDDVVSNLIEYLQPALILIIGIFVGLLFAAVLVPLYNLTSVI